LKFCENCFQNILNEIKIKLRDFDILEISLNNILNSEILLTDKVLQKLKIKDILEQIDKLEEGNNENLNNISYILFDILDDISVV